MKDRSVEGEVIDLGEPTKEVIEEEDCIVDGKMCLPQRTGELLSIVGGQERFMQSCSRFSEGLDLRNSNNRAVNKLHMASYELIAYVAAIEALLVTRREKVELKCPSCGEPVSKEEWKISEKFQNFVGEHTANNPVLGKAFKELYDDRSRFMHAGSSLHKYYAHRPNRPAILMGKQCVSETPEYYWNIHEYTGYLLRRFFYRQIR